MSEEILFIKQAIDALISTSEEESTLIPTIPELLERMRPTNLSLDMTTYLPNSNNDNSSNGDPVKSEYLFSSSIISGSLSFIVDDNELQDKFKYITPKKAQLNTVNHTPIRITSSLNGSQMTSKMSDIPISTNNHTSFISFRQRKDHRRKKIELPEKKFHCNKCELIFTKVTELKRHEKGHMLILPHVCSNCGKGFARKDALKRHGNTLTCNRNRRKLKEILGDKYEDYIARAHREGISI